MAVPAPVGRSLVLALVVLLCASVAHAAEASADTTAAARSSLSVVPALFYSPETRLGAGAFAIRTFRPAGADEKTRPSSVTVGLLGTVEKQALVIVAADLYRRGEAWRWMGLAGWSYFPTKFYGVGAETSDGDEEDYTPRTLALQAQGLPRVAAGLRAGARVEYQRLRLAEVESGGVLASGVVPGSGGGDAVGAGVVVVYDTRDNVFFPTRGQLHEASVMAFGGGLGGDFDWTRRMVDLRRYLPLGARHTVALQGLLVSNSGEPPFTQLGLLGGQNVLRGYYEGRDRDRNLAAVQAEYRRPLGARFGMALFAAGGTVARDLDGLSLSHLRVAGGAGLRYLLSVSEGINFRLDYGVGDDSSGMYFTATEAF
ncbi:MAG: BamA/TamA family outer membrane protein [Candidatus Krumholzibacteriia bacterium]